MGRLTADLIQQAPAFINPVKDREIDLRGHKIPLLENLGATQDQFDAIDLSDNEIPRLENFPQLKRLKALLLHNNHISRIDPNLGESLPNLETLLLTNNRLVNFPDIDNLADFPSLRVLSLVDNTITKRPNYRLYVAYRLPNVRVLDFKKIKSKERHDSIKIFGKPETFAARKARMTPKAKTFVPGEIDAEKEKAHPAITPIQAQAIRAAIEKASSIDEVNKLERALQSGHVPEEIMANYLRSENGKEKGEKSDVVMGESE
eukprot:TRINITY_DN3310_c0_g1_i2.p1 TRINITY_DN3310_c0_g1~~TRINITY_DN3310_c0_g1_i2.p1  ORF type:complete len:261 (-),score=57.45 TRINITY_DN3310_c0_g1_i2:181-963(-)